MGVADIILVVPDVLVVGVVVPLVGMADSILVVPCVLVVCVVVSGEGVVNIVLGLQPVLDGTNNAWTPVSDGLVISLLDFVGVHSS